MKETQKLWI